MRVRGKTALVTGAASGIGRATAKALAEAGARVVVVDVNEAKLAEVARELGDACAGSKRVDVSKRDEVRALADEWSAVDVLVNNAGIGQSGGILETRLEDWDAVVGVNFWGVVHGCHFFVPKMVARGAGGHVVNVASVFGLIAPTGTVAYCATKFAVVGLSESMRAELAPRGIGVTAVCPGMIATNIIREGIFADESMRASVASEFARRGHPPERVGRAIVRAIERDRAVVPVGPEAWIAWGVKRVSPSLVARVGSRIEQRARKGAG